MASFCAALSGAAPEDSGRIAAAAAFHDIGIWTDGTFDYLEPSIRVAERELRQAGHGAWVEEVGQMILLHHRIRPVGSGLGPLVEPFRRADWVDVTLGALSFGVPRPVIADSYRQWPDNGFHWRLVELAGKRLLSHPLSPLPMIRW